MVATASTPRNSGAVYATPLLSSSGISAVRLPLEIDRSRTTVAAELSSSARRWRRPPNSCATQSVEVSWHAASRLAACSSTEVPSDTLKLMAHD